MTVNEKRNTSIIKTIVFMITLKNRVIIKLMVMELVKKTELENSQFSQFLHVLMLQPHLFSGFRVLQDNFRMDQGYFVFFSRVLD